MDCHALLSTPVALSLTNGLPASYHTYLEYIIRGDGQESLGQWQERLYTFFADASLELLATLSDATIQLASDRWKALLRSKNLAENLYAGYISCKLQRHAPALFHNDSSPESSIIVSPILRAWIDKCYSNFQGQNGVQAVKGTLVRVLALTYHEAYRDVEHADVAIMLAGVFLDIAQQYYTGDWSGDNRDCTRKIAEKFSGAKTSLQVASIHILALLDPKDWLFDAHNICLKLLQVLTASSHLAEPFQHVHSTSIGMLLQAADRCMALLSLDQGSHTFALFIKSLWNFVIEQCRPRSSSTGSSLSGIAQALRIVQALQSLDQGEPSPLVTTFMKAVESMGIPEWWTLNLRTPGAPENCCGLPSCLHYEEIQRQRLCDKVTILLFSCGSHEHRKLHRSATGLLMQRLSEGCLGDEPPSCVYSPFLRLRQPPPSCHQQTLTSHNWRAHLGEEFKISTGATYDLVENMISTICRDLEDRCETVEVPLRAAHDKVHELTEAIAHLENQIAAITLDKERLEEVLLTQQNAQVQASSLSAGLEQTIANLKQQLDEAERQMEQMKAAKIDADEQVRRQLDEMQQKALDDIEHAEHEHATKVCELEAQLSSQVQVNHTLEHESSWLKEQTDLARSELVAAHEQQLEELNSQHAEEITNLNTQISQMQQKTAADGKAIDELTRDILERKQSIEELTHVRNDNATAISSLQSELAAVKSEKGSLFAELAELQASNKDLSAELAMQTDQVQKKDQRITELETVATRSQQRCAKLEKALTEARQREEGISALLAGRPSGMSAVSAMPARRTTLGAPMMRSQAQAFDNLTQAGFNAQQTSAPRLPENSFISDDDDDYYEIMKLPH